MIYVSALCTAVIAVVLLVPPVCMFSGVAATELYGPVVLDPSSQFFLGATIGRCHEAGRGQEDDVMYELRVKR